MDEIFAHGLRQSLRVGWFFIEQRVEFLAIRFQVAADDLVAHSSQV